MADGNQNVSDFEVSIGGKLSDAARGQVLSIRVDSISDGPDFFEIRFKVKSAADELPVDSKLTKLGEAVEIKMGYKNDLESVFKGEIAAVHFALHESESPIVAVTGWDKLHRLTRGRCTKHWEQIKYSDIASEFAGDAGVGADAEATSITFDYISMNNQSKLSFLHEIARRVGYEVDLREDKLFFGKPETSGSEVATLAYGEQVKRARFRTQTAGQVTKVRVLAWDDAEKKQVIGEATDSDVSALQGGDVGPKLAKTAFGEADYWVSVFGARKQEEVDEVAKAIINEKAYDLVEAEVLSEGEATVKAGKVVKLENCTDMFDGKYYVTRAVHLYDVGAGPNKGYRTRITASRPDHVK